MSQPETSIETASGVTRTDLRKYLAMMIGVYAVFSAVLRSAPADSNPGLLFFAPEVVPIAVSAYSFVIDHNRSMTASEKRRFAGWGTLLLLVWIITLSVGVFLQAHGLNQLVPEFPLL